MQDQLEEELAVYKERLRELEKQLSNQSASTDDVISKMDQLTTELESRNKQLRILTNEIKDKELQLSKMSESLGEKDTTLWEKNDRMEKLEKQLDQLMEQLEQNSKLQESDSADGSAELEMKGAQLMEALNKLLMQEKELKELAQQLEDKSCALEDMTIEKEAVEASLEELDEQQQEALAQLLKKTNSLQNAKDQLQTENDHLKGQRSPGLDLNADVSLIEQNSSLRSDVSAVKEVLQHVEDDAASRVSDKAIDEELANLRRQLEQSTTQVSTLTKEYNHSQSEVASMSEKLHKGAIAINDLHMDKKELQSQVSSLSSEVSDIKIQKQTAESEKSQLEQNCNVLQTDLNRTREELRVVKENSLSQNDTQSALQHDLERMQTDLNSSLLHSEKYQTRVAELETQMDHLQGQLDEAATKKQDLHRTLENSLQSAVAEKEELVTSFNDQVSHLHTCIDSLESQKRSLEKDLGKAESKAEEQAKQYENYIKELSQARVLDTSSLEAEHDRLMKASHDKVRQIKDLESVCDNLKAEVEDTKDMLQSTIDGQQQITDLLNEKESDIATLQSENRALLENNEENSFSVKQFTAEVERLTGVEKQFKLNLEETKKLKTNLDTSRAQVKKLESREETDKLESKTLDIITDLESEITNLNRQILKHDELEEQQNEQHITELKILQDSINEKESGVKHLEEKVKEQTHLIKQSSDTIDRQDFMMRNLKQTLSDKDREVQNLNATLEHTKAAFEQERVDMEKLGQPVEAQAAGPVHNGYSDDSEESKHTSTTMEEVEVFRKIISQKDDVIGELRQNNSSLLKMLEEHSMSIRGDRSLVELHKLGMEVSSLRMEREQIMSVLNEKSRECSTLKSEVHKLMNVISAEKTAISKLQQENQELAQKRKVHNDENEELTKEAVKNLSRIIRDKDLEIESLNQKNQSLLQVLQETSADGAQMSTIMQERDNLNKQIVVFEKDREQIIAAVNQKHQEAVLYYGEVQRLSTLRNQETEEQEELKEEFKTLSKHYEDKQQALLKANNQLVNYKQKYAAMDNQCKELLARQEENHNRINIDKNLTDADLQADHIVAIEQKIDIQESVPLGHSSNVLSEQNKADIEKLSTQLKGVRETLANKEQLIKEKQKQLEQQTVLIHEKNLILEEKEKSLIEKDRNLGELNARVHLGEETLRHRDSEISSIRKQQENLVFQMQGLQSEDHHLRKEISELTNQREALQAEVGLLKEANNRLNVTIGECELELNANREKVATLTQLVQEKEGVEEKGQVDQRMAETEAMQKQAQMFQQERDQAMTSLQAKQMELGLLTNEVSGHHTHTPHKGLVYQNRYRKVVI